MSFFTLKPEWPLWLEQNLKASIRYKTLLSQKKKKKKKKTKIMIINNNYNNKQTAIFFFQKANSVIKMW